MQITLDNIGTIQWGRSRVAQRKPSTYSVLIYFHWLNHKRYFVTQRNDTLKQIPLQGAFLTNEAVGLDPYTPNHLFNGAER
jgi:hypothetical protein